MNIYVESMLTFFIKKENHSCYFVLNEYWNEKCLVLCSVEIKLDTFSTRMYILCTYVVLILLKVNIRLHIIVVKPCKHYVFKNIQPKIT